MSARPPSATGPVARGVAVALVGARWLLVAAWIGAAVVATRSLPTLGQAQEQALTNLIPQDATALRTEVRSLQEFGFPVLARTVVVQRDPRGLSLQAQARVLERALTIDQHADPQLRGIAGAIPVVNTLKLLPGSRENGTTALTFLFFTPDAGLFTQQELAERFARTQINRPDDHLVGVTGDAPARWQQGILIDRALPFVEIATVLLVAGILGITYRAVGAPLLVLSAAGIAFLVSIRVVAWAGHWAGIAVPQELEPILVVLLLGIVTDYSIFFMTGMRNRLAAGDSRIQAARSTTASFLPIVVTAGLTVAGGTAALLVARLQFLRSFGPSLALTVLVTLAVAVTFVPAMLGIFGRWIFWPSAPRLAGVDAALEGVRRSWRVRLARATTARPVAALIAVVALAALVGTAIGAGGCDWASRWWAGCRRTTRPGEPPTRRRRGSSPGSCPPPRSCWRGAGWIRSRPSWSGSRS